MTGKEQIQSEDFAAFPRPALTVDLVLMSVIEGRLTALLQLRDRQPCAGCWALPGGFVGLDEGLDAAARRILATKARMDGHWLEQLYTFGEPNRDPRARVITVAYFALLPGDQFEAALRNSSDLALAEIIVPWSGEAGGPVSACSVDGADLALAFDHAEILGHAVKRLRGKLDYTRVGFALLPDVFTLRQLQDAHEAILGVQMNKPAFRRRMLDKGWIEGTGARETGASFRPAELYRVKD
jgi:8-oxo-dGTP diphosphatase